MDSHLAVDLGLESDPGGVGCGRVEPPHRLQEIGLLVGRRQQLQSQGQLHGLSVAEFILIVNGGAAPPHA